MTKAPSPGRAFGFLLSDVARTLRTVVDHEARAIGMTRAQWSVLARLQRAEGLKQNDLASDSEIAPITLARIIDRLDAAGLVERRPDPEDRRVNRLYLTKAAGPILDRLAVIGEGVMQSALAGLSEAETDDMINRLQRVHSNLKTHQKTRESARRLA